MIGNDRAFGGNLWAQLDGVTQYLRDNLDVEYRIKPEGLSVEALQRQEVWPYPREALREAALNARMHRDYADPGDIQVRLQSDRLSLWNPTVAQVFYYAGLVERWGSGITRIRQALRAQGLPEPEMAEEAGGFRFTFLRDAYMPELLRAKGLSERQIKGVMYVKENGSIGNREYRELVGVSERTATNELRKPATWGKSMNTSTALEPLSAVIERFGPQRSLARIRGPPTPRPPPLT